MGTSQRAAGDSHPPGEPLRGPTLLLVLALMVVALALVVGTVTRDGAAAIRPPADAADTWDLSGAANRVQLRSCEASSRRPRCERVAPPPYVPVRVPAVTARRRDARPPSAASVHGPQRPASARPERQQPVLMLAIVLGVIAVIFFPIVFGCRSATIISRGAIAKRKVSSRSRDAARRQPSSRLSRRPSLRRGHRSCWWTPVDHSLGAIVYSNTVLRSGTAETSSPIRSARQHRPL